MKLIKPKFWIDKNIISFLLFPLTIFTHLINIFKKLYPKKKFKIKTICIGNISVGGTGKTSLAIQLKKILGQKVKNTFIKKNYINQIDEINLLKKNGSIISSSERLDALKIAEKKGYKLAILDDGLQQKNINYDLKIVCFNADEGVGNGFLLPAGPLREKLSELKNYDLVFINGKNSNIKLYNKIKSINKNLKIFYAKYQPTNLKDFKGKKNYLMFCGIGNPHEFENTLSNHNFKIKKKIIFPDHYKISISEINKIKKIAKKEKLNIITTEKDYYRLNKKQKKNIKFLRIKLEIKDITQLKKILFNINEKN